jgi:hypothetical protein
VRAVAAGTLVALALASCGSGGNEQAGDDPCTNPTGFRPAGSVLPRNMIPAGLVVGAVRHDGKTVSGSTFFPSPLQDAYANLKARGANAGYQLATDDNEGFEAELGFLRARGDQLFFKLTQIQGCSSVTAGTFWRKDP